MKNEIGAIIIGLVGCLMIYITLYGIDKGSITGKSGNTIYMDSSPVAFWTLSAMTAIMGVFAFWSAFVVYRQR